MIKRLIFIGITIFLIGCGKTKKENETTSIEQVTETIHKTYTKSAFLNESATKELTVVKHFAEFESKMNLFYKLPPEEAKLNAKELSDLIIKLKDSINIQKIDRPDVKARFNILNNEVLRLYDMSTISTISKEEVVSKIENIIYAYESIILKINQVYLMNENEESVDVQFQAPKVLLDSLPKELKKQR